MYRNNVILRAKHDMGQSTSIYVSMHTYWVGKSTIFEHYTYITNNAMRNASAQ